MMATRQPWAVVEIVGPDGTVLGTIVADGPGRPDMAAVDDLARTQLMAKRLGGRAVVKTASPFFLELLDLAGLAVEVERQPKEGENGGRIEEGVDPGDPAP
jgi:hypothetical protein